MKTYRYKDLDLSAFCLGCAQFGQRYGIANKGDAEEKESGSIIKRFVESGANFFDTAADYGESEAILGKHLLPFKDRRLTVATKIRYIKGENPAEDVIKKVIRESLEDSLRRLQRSRLDIVYIHQYKLFFEFPELFLEILRDYKEMGLIGHIGISLYEPEEADEALKYDEIEVFQIVFNVLNRSFEKSGKIKLLQEKGKLIADRSIFLQGLFSMEPDSLPEFFDPVKGILGKFYKEVGEAFGSKEEFFLGHAISKDFGPIILGSSSLSQLEKNLAVFNSNSGFDDPRFGDTEKRVPELEKIYIDPRNWNL